MLVFAFREASAFDWRQVTPTGGATYEDCRAPRQPLPKVFLKSGRALSEVAYYNFGQW